MDNDVVCPVLLEIRSEEGDYVIVPESQQSGPLLLKHKSQFLAERQLGRPLSEYEFPRIEANGEVRIEQTKLPYPWPRVEVKSLPEPLAGSIMVTDDGDLVSLRTKKFLAQNRVRGEKSDPYIGAITRVGGRDGQVIAIVTHRAVADAFVANDSPEVKTTVNHKDGQKRRNESSNLEWVTPSENTQHAYDIGLIKPIAGTLNANSKFSEQDLNDIRKLYFDGGTSMRMLGKTYKVNHATISRMLNGKRYKPKLPMDET